MPPGYQDDVLKKLSIPPRDRRGVPLLAAVHEYAPEEWSKYKEASGKGGQWELLAAAWGAVERRLLSGELIATGFGGTVRATIIPAEAWQVLKPQSWGDLTDSTVKGAKLEFRQVRIRSKGRPSTTAIERACDAWFVAQLQAHPGRRTFDEMLQSARRELGEQLPHRVFRRVWIARAPKSWKLPGRKPRT